MRILSFSLICAALLSSRGYGQGSNTQIIYNKSGTLTGNANNVFYDTALPQPAIPTITQNGTTGTKLYYYSVVPIGGLGFGLASPYATLTTGFATLSVTNYNIVTTSAVTGAASCDVFRDVDLNRAPDGNWKFIQNISCGSVYNDVGTNAGMSTCGEGGNGLVDESAGQGIGTNLMVSGSLSVGGGIPGTGGDQTSGISQFNVSQTVQGSSAPISDPALVTLGMNIDPSGLGVNQPWLLQGSMTVAGTNGSNIPALEGVSVNVNDGGTGTLTQVDGVLSQVTLGPSVTSPIGTLDISLLNAGNFFAAVSNQVKTLTGVLAAVSATGSTGLVNRADAFRTVGNGTGGNGQTITALHGFSADPPQTGGGVTNYDAFHADDGHATGTSTSYAFHSVGSLFANLFEGPVNVGSLISKGTKFTISGCSAGTTVGGPTAGQFVSGTTGACTVTVTMGQSATAPNGWACAASDISAPANLISQSATSTTTCTLTGMTASGDTLIFHAIAY